MEKNQDWWLIKLECKCPTCGKIFYVWDRSKWAYKSYEKKGHKAHLKHYCSWRCMRAVEKERKGEEKKCARCGRLLEKGSKGAYCDMCKTLLFIEEKRAQTRQEQSKAKQTEEKNKLQELENRKCLYCGKPIPMYKRENCKYCCPEHRHMADLKRRCGKRLQKKREELGDRECLYCGEPIPAEAIASKKFCCRLHAGKYDYNHRKLKKMESQA